MSIRKEDPYWSTEPATLDLIREAFGEEWITRHEDGTPAFLRLVSLANHRVLVVTGELSPGFFEQDQVIEMLDKKLRDGVEFQFVFDKPRTHSVREAEASVLAQNPKLSALKREFPGGLRLFWAGRRPSLQFVVVDAAHTLHEEPDHPAGERPETVIRYGHSGWARAWEKRFEEVRDGPCTEILHRYNDYLNR